MGSLVQQKVKILFVAANLEFGYLRMDKEIQAIQREIRSSEHRDLLDIQQIWNASPRDLLEALNQHKPHVVHFSAHGTQVGEIILNSSNGEELKPVSAEVLKEIFVTLKDNVRVVVLNACYSRKQAKAIASVIDCAIGMNAKISDKTAIPFAAMFYQAIGYGRSVEEAFQQAKVLVKAEEGIDEYNVPKLLTRLDVDARKVYVVLPQELQTAQTIQKQQEQILNSLLNKNYDGAYYEIDQMLRNNKANMSSAQLAQLRYMEALVHLDGKRPYSHSPSVISTVESLLRQAIVYHPLYSFTIALAVIKLDFARAGLYKHKLEAEQLLHSTYSMQKKSADHENILVLANSQAALFQDYQSYLVI